MKKTLLIPVSLAVILLVFGCDKEKTITSSEYIHETECVQGPTDTVLVIDTVVHIDTVYQYDSTVVENPDTVIIVDTIVEHITDTVIEYINDTTFIVDTVTVVQNIYDTVRITDTVIDYQCLPYVQFAFSSMQHHLDPLVIDFINAEFGYTDGWILYLSMYQSDVTNPSTGVYEFYGYIDYWTPDWSAYYPLEYYYRMSYLGDDPSDPGNWQLSEPAAASQGRSGGLGLSAENQATMPGR